MITLNVGLFLGLLGLATWSIFCNIHILYKWHKQIKEGETSEEEYKNRFLSFKNARERQYDLTITNPSQIKESEVV